jgi:hypothetical protein
MRFKDDSTSQTRAEEVRLRRGEHTQERVKRAAKSVSYQATAPTILVRNGASGTPIVRRAKIPVRRPLVIPLNTPGAEVVMPSFPELKPGWRLLSGFLVLLFGALIALATSAPQLRVTQPEVSGLNRLNSADIAAVIRASDEQIYLFDANKATTALQAAFPELKDIQISVELPAKVKITAVERQPVVTWKNNDQLSWIDKEGVVFPVRGEANTMVLTIDGGEIPILKAIENSDQTDKGAVENTQPQEKSSVGPKRINTSLLEAALKLSETLPAETVLAYSPEEGLGWNAPEGWKVYIGTSLNDLSQKLNLYQQLTDQLKQQEITPKLVSVAFLYAPFYRVE